MNTSLSNEENWMKLIKNTTINHIKLEKKKYSNLPELIILNSSITIYETLKVSLFK